MDTWIKQLESDAYCILSGLFSQDQVQEALGRAKEIYAAGSETTSENVPFLNRNQPMVYNLQSKDLYFVDLLFESEQLQQGYDSLTEDVVEYRHAPASVV